MRNPKLLMWSVTAALSGFLLGFDIVVISGAEKTIQSLWGLSAGMHDLTMSIALWGMAVGALMGVRRPPNTHFPKNGGGFFSIHRVRVLLLHDDPPAALGEAVRS